LNPYGIYLKVYIELNSIHVFRLHHCLYIIITQYLLHNIQHHCFYWNIFHEFLLFLGNFIVIFICFEDHFRLICLILVFMQYHSLFYQYYVQLDIWLAVMHLKSKLKIIKKNVDEDWLIKFYIKLLSKLIFLMWFPE